MRWIDTQELLFTQCGLERCIEVGIAEQPTLMNMANSSLATLGLDTVHNADDAVTDNITWDAYGPLASVGTTALATGKKLAKVSAANVGTSLGGNALFNDSTTGYDYVILGVGGRRVAQARSVVVDTQVLGPAVRVDTRNGIVEGRAADIVYSNLFTGVHGNYLRGSIERAGLDPDNLPEGDLKTMNFGSGGNMKAKAWRDIWGSGQGIGAVKAVQTAGEMVARLKREYAEAQKALAAAGTWPQRATERLAG